MPIFTRKLKPPIRCFQHDLLPSDRQRACWAQPIPTTPRDQLAFLVALALNDAARREPKVRRNVIRSQAFWYQVSSFTIRRHLRGRGPGPGPKRRRVRRGVVIRSEDDVAATGTLAVPSGRGSVGRRPRVRGGCWLLCPRRGRTTGASAPRAYAGSGNAVLNGKLYMIGGCAASSCGTTDAYAYDASTNSWSQIASYPEPVSWSACGGIHDLLYCAGGSTDTGTTQHAYVYDPSANSWSPIADLPTDLWGSSYTAANGLLLTSGGVVNGSTALTNQGFAFDPEAGTTLDWNCGKVEGNVNRAKRIKRDGYGRAGFDLLRLQILLAD